MLKAAKITGWILLPIFLWAAFVLLHKESLDDGLSDFYQPRQKVAQEQDATVFLNGLAAPAGKDVVAHGLLVARTYAEGGVDFENAKQKVAALGELGLTFNADELDCWMYGPGEGAIKQSCASAKQVSGLIKNNALLLERYQALTALSFSRSADHNLQLFLNLNRLLAAQILLESRTGKPEAAFQRWKNNFAFLNRAGGSPSGWIDRAVILVSYGFAQTSLEELLYSYPDLAVKHRVELLELLDGNIDLWRVDEALRGDYAMLERNFFAHSSPWYFDAGFVRNRIYRTDQALLDTVMKTRVASLRSEIKLAVQQHIEPGGWTLDYVLNPLSTMVAKRLMSGKLKGGELIMYMWEKAAYNRLLTLRVQAATPAGRSDVAGLVAKSPTELHNPFNERPMIGLPKQRLLWFAYNGCSTVRQVRLPSGRFFTQEEIAGLRDSYSEQCS